MAESLNQSGGAGERDLTEFVEGLRFAETQKDIWQEWTRDDLLFRALQKAVRASEVKNVKNALGRIDAYRVNMNGDRPLKVWNCAHALIWCASQACLAPASLKPLRAGGNLDEYRGSLQLER